MHNVKRGIELPEWMNDEPIHDLPGYRKGKGHRFLGKSLHNLRTRLSDELMTEHYARQDGCLQKIDPRAKLITMIILIGLAGFTQSLMVFLVLWFLTLILMFMANLPVINLQKRIWGFIPLLTLIISIPAMLNLFNGGEPLFIIHKFHTAQNWLGISIPQSIFISRQGVGAALFLFLRVGISLSFGIILTMSTPVASLLKALKVLGLPALFIMIIEMTYRYIGLLINISIEMFEARSMRTVGSLSLIRRRAQVGSSIAALFGRSMALSEEVFQSMIVRCYTGEVSVIESEPYNRLELSRSMINWYKDIKMT